MREWDRDRGCDRARRRPALADRAGAIPLFNMELNDGFKSDLWAAEPYAPGPNCSLTGLAVLMPWLSTTPLYIRPAPTQRPSQPKQHSQITKSLPQQPTDLAQHNWAG